MNEKNAVITGCAGFIGSNLARRLVNEGWNVTAVDDLSAGKREFLPKVNRFLQADFADPQLLDAIKRKQFSHVFHLGAKPRVSYSVEHPLETHDTNVTKTLALLDACKGNVKRFINTSSSSVYGGAQELPTKESVTRDPKSPYALQKAIIEDYCRLYYTLYGLDTVSVRPFNVFGPNCLGDNPYATAVSAWLYAAKHDKPLRSDGDGTQTRDVTYVTNVVDVFVRAAEHPATLGGFTVNAGTGTSVSNSEVLEWFRKRFPGCKVTDAPWRPGDVMHTLADLSTAKAVFGYEPVVDFWKGLELTASWAMNSAIF